MGPFSTVPGCTWLYLTMPGCTWLYLALPWSAMIYLSTDCHILPLSGLNAFVYIHRLKCSKAISGWDGINGLDGNLCKLCGTNNVIYKWQTHEANLDLHCIAEPSRLCNALQSLVGRIYADLEAPRKRKNLKAFVASVGGVKNIQ